MQRILHGQINMLEFPMVNATDFATPRSNLSALMNIKIYGTLIGNSAITLVTSGVGSLAASNRDVVHIGASATGVYAVPLGPAQLSTAGNIYYDHYTVIITATSAAQQVMLLSGVRASLSDILSTMNSQFAAVSNYLSNASNYLSNLSAMLSDVDSALTSQFVNQSNFFSQLSDIMSDVLSTMGSQFTVLNAAASNAYSAAVVAAAAASNVNSLVQNASWMSDLASHVWTAKYTALNGASSFGSAMRLTMSRVSDLQSFASDLHSDLRSLLLVTGVSLTSDTMSNLRSAITAAGGGAGATPSAVWAYGYSNLTAVSSIGSLLRGRLSTVSGIYSGISNLQSRVDARVATRSQLSDIHSDLRSFITADLYSQLSDFRSDLLSRLGTTGVSLTSDTMSNLRSAIATITASIGASDYSNIARYVWNEHYAAAAYGAASTYGSLFRRGASVASDTYSMLISRVPDITTTGSDLISAIWVHPAASDLISKVSDLRSRALVAYAVLSDFYSDFQSRVPKLVATNSQLSDVQSDLRSFLTADLYSQLSDFRSDLLSLLATTGVTLTSDMQSNLRSAITAAAGGAGATPSALWAYGYSNLVAASTIGSLLRGRMSTVSGIYSGISNLQSRVDSMVSSRSQLSTLHSDLKSLMLGINATTSDILSTMGSQFTVLNAAASNAYSAAVVAAAAASNVNSLVQNASWMSDVASHIWTAKYTALNGPSSFGSALRLTHSRVSDLQSFLSDMHSDLRSVLATRSQLTAVASDIKSAVNAGGLTSDVMSDIAVALWNEHYATHLGASSFGSAVMRGISAASDAASAAQQGNSRALVAQSTLSNLYELMSDVESQLDATTAVLSDLQSDFQSRVPGRVLVRADALAELTAVAPSTPTQEQALMMLFMRERNNTKMTTTTRKIRNAAGTTIASAALLKDSTSLLQGTLA